MYSVLFPFTFFFGMAFGANSRVTSTIGVVAPVLRKLRWRRRTWSIRELAAAVRRSTAFHCQVCNADFRVRAQPRGVAYHDDSEE
jgi:hypothetical protein